MNTDLPNQPEEDAALEALLKEPAPYIPDEGFTARVMATLPQKRTGLVRKIILIGSSAVGFVLAALWLPWQQLGPLWTTQPIQDSGSDAAWLAVFTVLASLAWTVTNALSDEPEMR